MMTSNICWLLVRLAILLGVLLVRSSEEATYQDFLNRHIDYPVTSAPNLNAYCNLMMVRRGMTRPACKPTNTFIHASATVVRPVCGSGGTLWQGNLYDSRSYFNVVVCRSTGGSPPNGCRYRGQAQNKRVRLGCVNNLPVHFQQLLP